MSTLPRLTPDPFAQTRKGFGNWWQRAWQEPFRLFFPWGILVGMLGVALWPLFFAKILPFYPNIVHARMMIIGWGGAMVLGFIATAGPRLFGAERFSMGEVRMLWMVHAATLIAFFRADDATGCGLFAATLILLLIILTGRFNRRIEMPPPRFTLVLLGLLSGITGCVMIANGWDMRYGSVAFRFARLLLDEGFLLLPALGISSFLIPRTTGLHGGPIWKESRAPSRAWWRAAMQSLLVGAVILVSFYLEASGNVAWGQLTRLTAVLSIWMVDFPKLWIRKMHGTQAWMLRLALAAMPLAWVARLIDPVHLYAVEHILFISGFGVLMLIVASRVVDAHSDQPEASRGTSKPLRWIYWLSLLALLTRVSADYVPSIQVSHYLYAAITWIIIFSIWLAAYWRKLNRPPPDGGP